MRDRLAGTSACAVPRLLAPIAGRFVAMAARATAEDRRAAIMRHRVAMCGRKGFDAVEFDNIDGYQSATGFRLTGAQQLRLDVFLANAAHRRGVSALLKNDLGQVPTLLPYFDASLDGQCFRYRECGGLKAFLNAGKPVFQVEYELSAGSFCEKANAKDFNSMRKRLALDGWRVPCRGA